MLRPMLRSLLVALAAISMGFSPPSAMAQAVISDPVLSLPDPGATPAGAVFSLEQVHSAFANAGFEVDPTLHWDWASPLVSSFRVRDVRGGRVLMVLVYPSTTIAATARAQAQARENAGSGMGLPGVDPGVSPHLVVGYGPSVWTGNVALVESTESQLQRMYQFDNDCDTSMYVNPNTPPDPSLPAFAVDSDFQQVVNVGHIGG